MKSVWCSWLAPAETPVAILASFAPSCSLAGGPQLLKGPPLSRLSQNASSKNGVCRPLLQDCSAVIVTVDFIVLAGSKEAAKVVCREHSLAPACLV
jgi:hypothetical protein